MLKHATPEATKAYALKYPKIKFNRLGSTGLTVSPAGFGSYRVHITVDQQQQALRDALSSGINLIDTSSNYGDGGAEELIGAVLKSMLTSGRLTRDEIVIVSKAGYIQGQNLKVVAERAQSAAPFPEVISINNELGHCIHPDYLSDQLERSLRRLQIKTTDFFLLHNPEYYFYEAEQKKLKLEDARKEFYRRIEQAFIHLELLADAGKLVNYGVSANSLPLVPDDSHYVDIRRLWEIAYSIRPDHHFRMVQFPMNLLEPEAAVNQSPTDGKTLLQFALEKDLAALTNRPLNAFKDGQLKRLVSIQLNSDFDMSRLEKSLNLTVKLEEEFANKIINQLQLEAAIKEKLIGLFATGNYFAAHYKTIATYWSWLGQHAHFISEQVSYAVQKVNEAPDNPPQVIEWLDAYVQIFNDMLDQLTRFYGWQAEKFAKSVLRLLAPGGNVGLTHVALQALWDSAGVSTVLIGMRRPEYVAEVIGYLQAEDKLPLPSWQGILRILKSEEI